MLIEDDRTPEQMLTHNFLVVATDRFMSGWGKAEGGTSYAAWACREVDVHAVAERVRRRGDMTRVRIVVGRYRPRGKGHLHIYVHDERKGG